MNPYGVTDEQINDVLCFRRLTKEQLITLLSDYDRGMSFRMLSKIISFELLVVISILLLLSCGIIFGLLLLLQDLFKCSTILFQLLEAVGFELVEIQSIN